MNQLLKKRRERKNDNDTLLIGGYFYCEKICEKFFRKVLHPEANRSIIKAVKERTSLLEKR